MKKIEFISLAVKLNILVGAWGGSPPAGGSELESHERSEVEIQVNGSKRYINSQIYLTNIQSGFGVWGFWGIVEKRSQMPLMGSQMSYTD